MVEETVLLLEVCVEVGDNLVLFEQEVEWVLWSGCQTPGIEVDVQAVLALDL